MNKIKQRKPERSLFELLFLSLLVGLTPTTLYQTYQYTSVWGDNTQYSLNDVQYSDFIFQRYAKGGYDSPSYYIYFDFQAQQNVMVAPGRWSRRFKPEQSKSIAVGFLPTNYRQQKAYHLIYVAVGDQIILDRQEGLESFNALLSKRLLLVEVSYLCLLVSLVLFLLFRRKRIMRSRHFEA